MSQSIGVRVIRRLNAALGSSQRSQICGDVLPRLEDELRREANGSLDRGDYVKGARDLNELIFLAQVENVMCPHKAPKGRPVFVA